MKIITYLQIFAILLGIVITTFFFNHSSQKDQTQITNLIVNSINPYENDTLSVSVDVVNESTIKTVSVFYKFDQDSINAIEMKRLDNKNTFSARIIPPHSFSIVSFYIESETLEGEKVYFPSTAPNKYASFTIETLKTKAKKS